MGFIPDDRCSLKTKGLWICFFLTYLYGACQSASADNCSMALTASEGNITSPGYPGSYINNLDCTYVIVGDGQNHTITIDLVDLALETVSGCSNDWLIIDGGPKLCYATPFHKTYAFRDRFVINFRSDTSNTGRGFKIRYAIDVNDNCTSIHLKTSGQILTPCYSCNCTYNNCTNTIIASGKLQILTLNYTTSANCDLGWFTIDGGPRICTSTPFATIYAFFGSVDIVTHDGDRSVDSCGGFVVNYVVEESCSMTLTASEGEITSPGYPGNYINYLNCTYVIVGDGQTESIIIDLVELDLETTTNCYLDWLVIDDGPKLCYPTPFNKTYAFLDRFVIKFRTDYSVTRRGFKIRYSFDSDAHDNCTSIHLKTSGQILAPCYSCDCTYDNCTNTIRGSGKLQSLTLDFVSVNFTTSSNCDRGWFTIDGGPKICTSVPFKTTYAFFGSTDIVTHGGGRSVDSCGGFVVDYVVEVDGGLTQWNQWSGLTCTRTCGVSESRTVVRTRSCTNPAPQNGGNNCTGSTFEVQNRNCGFSACPINGGLTQWAQWNVPNCPQTCGSTATRTVTRTRSCTNPVPQFGGTDCTGLGTSFENQVRNCGLSSCPTDGGLSLWTHWNIPSCSVTCGVTATRVVTRTRSCTNPPPSDGGRDCTGLGAIFDSETRNCGLSPCPSNY
ncbi:cubilin-like isoform X2 [Haliotis rufescens]|uniref:cubilin-like isoform X2 n=1 Tax=Haliotis rufescens TaxID=6454 RepID=UPI00201F0A07|nr:cubilin-like isoform X2 [Haliotis rufescens]